MRDEYNFEKGERGKYAERYKEGTNLVLLDPEVAKYFPNSKSVNRALQGLISQGKVQLPKNSSS
ncbi:hypothetical protein ACFL1V_03260 [Pseudomonadota bacterium]